MNQERKSRTLSREDWLEKALTVVSRAGGAKLRVESLVAAVGVTKGSFYWHFRNRDHFVNELIDFWHDRYTLSVTRHFDSLDAPAEEKLRQLMEMVFVNRLSRYDLAFRAWAIAEPNLRQLVKRTDLVRLKYVKALFEGIGFDAHEADLRSRVFIANASWEAAMFERMTREQRKTRARAFFHLLTTRNNRDQLKEAS